MCGWDPARTCVRSRAPGRPPLPAALPAALIFSRENLAFGSCGATGGRAGGGRLPGDWPPQWREARKGVGGAPASVHPPPLRPAGHGPAQPCALCWARPACNGVGWRDLSPPPPWVPFRSPRDPPGGRGPQRRDPRPPKSVASAPLPRHALTSRAGRWESMSKFCRRI